MHLQMNKLATFFIVAVIAALGIYLLVDRNIRCSENGLSRPEAAKIAQWKLDMQFEKNLSFSHFTLEKARFEADKIWVFTYHSADCEVDVIVDKCGVADIGGLSKGCLKQ